MRKHAILIILISVISVVVTQAAEAAIIHVTTTKDNVPGSLRAAFTTAFTYNKDNTIIIPAGTYILMGVGEAKEDDNVSGDLDIKTRCMLTIKGKGKFQTFIHGNNNDRVLHILNGMVSITDLTIQKGNGLFGGNSKGGDGGGIYNSADLTLIRCVIRENVAGDGGWWHANGLSGGNGGGIYNSGTLVIDNCIITNNKAGNGSESDDIGGNGGSGGGIYNIGILTLNKCIITDNKSGNGAWLDGIGGEGGGVCNRGTSIISGCTVSGNESGSGDYYAGRGGGIFNGTDAYLSLANCTVSGNHTGERDYSASGGGLYNAGDSRLTGVTIVNNTAGTNSNTYEGYGGGIYNGGNIILINAIIAYNGVPNIGYGADCYGTFDWVCYSVIADTRDCALSGYQKANILGQDPLLGPLADNGGPTKTHALLPGSPAIDAGNSSGSYTDQRGYKRPINILSIPNVSDGADIGAYEYIAPFSTSKSH
ncbi:MAG: fibronectin-binding autotransporter adhesin [Acidobacteriota bacterium]|nr:fibronectin-binding autotransporter adhesin [Acidobacteriota bacterium]